MVDRITPTLRSQANKRVKAENTFLYKKFHTVCIEHFLNFRNGHYIVILTVSLFFFLQIIDIPELDVLEITGKTVKELIENRASNIVTLISVTFAVIGFLIANLVIKDSYIYNLIFKYSRFFSITAFVLTLIGSFIILSTLKNHIPIESVKRIFVVGTYLLLIGIFFIGYLFTRIIRYTNDRYLNKIVKKDFHSESKRYLIDLLNDNYMKEMLFNELGFKVYSYSSFFQNNYKSYPDEKLPVNSKILDIRIRKLQGILKKSNIPTSSVFLNLNYDGNFMVYQNGFFSIYDTQQTDHEKTIKKLNRCLILENKPTEELPIETVLDYVNQKIVEHVSKNNDKLVSEFTSIYSEYYKLKINAKFYA